MAILLTLFCFSDITLAFNSSLVLVQELKSPIFLYKLMTKTFLFLLPSEGDENSCVGFCLQEGMRFLP